MKKVQDILRIDHIAGTALWNKQFHIEYYSENYPVTDKPHRHNFYEILWFPEGKGMHYIDGVCFEITGNDLFLISEGQMHSYKNVGHLEGYFLIFKDTFWEDALRSIHNFKTTLFNPVLINGHLQLEEEYASEINHLMKHILTEFSRIDYPDKPEVIIAYLKILLVRISNLKNEKAIASPHARKNNYVLFQQFIAELEQRYTQNHEVGFYADKLHITSKKLADICREYNSRNPKEVIEDRILITAKRQLQFDASAVKQIASTVGFADQFQFSKFFKKLTGISPAEYRLQFMKK